MHASQLQDAERMRNKFRSDLNVHRSAKADVKLPLAFAKPAVAR